MSTEKSDPIVRVYHANRSQGSFQHGEHKLVPGGHCDVPQSIADLWLSHKAQGQELVLMREAIAPSEAVQAENAKLREETAALAAESASQADKIANLEKLLEQLRNGVTPKIPVVADQPEGEAAPGQQVVFGEELKQAQADKDALTTKPRRR